MKPLPWSHSTLASCDTCPRQYEELKVLRNFQDQKNDASMWGDEFHKAAEKYLRNEAALPANMAQYAPYLNQFSERPGALLVEREYAIDRNLKPCAFLGDDVWGRGIIDVLTLLGSEAWVDDHKTGKRKHDPQQLVIFAILVFYHHPEVNTVHTRFHWLKEHASDGETYYRHQLPELWQTLIPKLQRYKTMFDAGIFPPKPSGLCKKHCAVKTCEYWTTGPRR